MQPLSQHWALISAPLVFFDSTAPPLAGTRLPSREYSLQSSCCSLSFNSLKKAPDFQPDLSLFPIPQPPPLGRRGRKFIGQIIQASPTALNPQNALPALAVIGAGPPAAWARQFQERGPDLCPWALVNSSPYHAISSPSALLPSLTSHLGKVNYCKISPPCPVLKQLLLRLIQGTNNNRVYASSSVFPAAL